MKTPFNPKKLAPLGLYLSLLAAILTIGMAIILREFSLPVQIGLGIVVIGIALFVMLDPERTRVLLTGRQAKYGSNVLILFLASAGILIIINILGASSSVRLDLTQDKTHTLAQETIAILNSLSEPVTAKAFYSSQTNSTTAKSLLEDFKANSGGKFSYQFIDPNSDPIAARNANITRDGTIVLTQAGRTEIPNYASEQELAAALIRINNPGDRAVYFLAGHGEYDINASSGEQTLRTLKQSLVDKNYLVQTLDLLSNPVIPDDAKAIVIAGLTQSLSEKEISLIKAYLENGGALVVFENPSIMTQLPTSSDLLAAYLETTWGIKLGEDFIIDTTANQLDLNNPSLAIVVEYGNHAITNNLNWNLYAIFPSARSVTFSEKENITTTALAKTSQYSWAETDLAGLLTGAQVQYDQTKDTLGPVNLAAAAENSLTHSRIVVFGDPDFAADANFNAYQNGTLAVNAIDWAAQQENLINLTPRQTTERMVVPPDRFTMGFIFLGFVLALPGSAIVAGIVVWIQRRRRG
ncbi:MAG TPA: GldG family protein [Anaerolineaceae bacterium]|mgnify:CR=1 FL=1|nr:GldG family protein [Anaerolineaceae bacterium]HPN50851.1 GldG family protein [Anaerolineaceae bacterium]